MKFNRWHTAGIILALFILLLNKKAVFRKDTSSDLSVSKFETSSTNKEKVFANLVVDFGEEKKVAYQSISSTSAYDILLNAQVEVLAKEYDFGLMVEEIDGVGKDKDRAWIYYVNGKSGSISADKFKLQDGDRVEWKYTQINK